jgi:hypothetical protein
MGNLVAPLVPLFEQAAKGSGPAYLEGSQAAALQSNTALDPVRAQLLKQQAAAEAARAQSEAALTQGQQLKNQEDQLLLNDQRIEGEAMRAVMLGGQASPTAAAPAAGGTSSSLDNAFNSPGMAAAGGTAAAQPQQQGPAPAPKSPYGPDPFALPMEMLRRGASAAAVSKAQQNAFAWTQNSYTLSNEQRDAKIKDNEALQAPMEGYFQAASDPKATPDQLVYHWNTVLQTINGINPAYGAMLARMAPPNTAPKADLVTPLIYNLATEASALKRAQDLATVANTNAEQKLRGAQQAEAEANTAAKTQETAQARQKQAGQDISGVQSQDEYNAWLQKYPEEARTAPAMYSPAFVASRARTAVPVAEQPKYDLEVSQARALKAMVDGDPQKLDELVDSIVPKNDPMNASTKVMARHAAALGDAKGIQKVIQDAYDQRGRVQVAKETQANRISLDLGAFSGSAQNPSNIAKAVANYQMPLSQAVGRGGPPARAALLDQVLALNPQFQEQYYNTFQKTENAFTSGKESGQAQALNTMMGHLEVLDRAADALKNSDVPALNRIANFLGYQTGSTAQTTYNTIVSRLGAEVGKSYGEGTGGERLSNAGDFSSDRTPDQLKQAIGTAALLADSKIKALQDQYTRGTYGRGQQKLITDEAEAARQRLAGRAANLQQQQFKVGQTVTLRNGKTVTVTAVHPDGTFDAK